jgi:hypothetical protein|nr:MAG TPA_asm: hypothetical protein [Caudoviricetes sp.]
MANISDEMRDMAVEWEECYDSGTIYAKTAATFARKWAKELEDRYVELPTDAKGEPWHVGDRCVTKYGGHGEVFGLRYDDDGKCRITVRQGDELTARLPSDLRRPCILAERLRSWVEGARNDEHMDLRELDRIADAMDGGVE